MDKIEKLLRDFIMELNKNKEYKIIPAGEKSSNNYSCNIYNEISLQHELGKYMENILKTDGYKIFYEKNIYDTKEERIKEGWVKKEIDIVLYNENNGEKYAIELKFSKGENARTPENLFDYIKDIKFMETVKKVRGYTNVYNLMIANSQKYYKGELNREKCSDKYDIYQMFRIKTDNKNIRKFKILRTPENMNYYCKPTGEKSGTEFALDREYSGNWNLLFDGDFDDDEKIYQYRYILLNHNN